LQKIVQQDDMKQMMMDFASTTQAELEAERGELQVHTQHACCRMRHSGVEMNRAHADQTHHGRNGT
jgi:hypothetical protein